MIRRHKTTIFTDAKESTTVYELKRIVEGILKRPPEEQILYKVAAGLRVVQSPPHLSYHELCCHVCFTFLGLSTGCWLHQQ